MTIEALHFFAPYLAIVAALFGLWAAVSIYSEKRKKQKMVCPLQANCDKVVHSTHAMTMGIPNELLGIGYYVVVGATYALSLMRPEILSVGWVQYLLALATIVGVLFSLYLVALQAFVIKAWCSWCMLSACSSILLATALFLRPLDELFVLLAAHRSLWLIVHGVGFVLGVGAATITDVFFFRFLKDHQITESEKKNFDTLSSVIWAGLSILVVSGLMLFLSDQARLAASAKFLLKAVVVGVIILNGIALNLLVSPRMRQLSFDGTKPARHFRRLAFALGGISITSWYVAFILGSLRSIGEYSFTDGLIGYGIVLVCVVIGSQLFERLAVKKYQALADTTPADASANAGFH